MNRLTEREAQAKLANEGDETEANPLNEAQDYPSRFQTLSFFLEDEEGIEIVQDLDDGQEDSVRVYYFWQGGREMITEGALYEWALERWEED